MGLYKQYRSREREFQRLDQEEQRVKFTRTSPFCLGIKRQSRDRHSSPFWKFNLTTSIVISHTRTTLVLSDCNDLVLAIPRAFAESAAHSLVNSTASMDSPLSDAASADGTPGNDARNNAASDEDDVVRNGAANDSLDEDDEIAGGDDLFGDDDDDVPTKRYAGCFCPWDAC